MRETENEHINLVDSIDADLTRSIGVVHAARIAIMASDADSEAQREVHRISDALILAEEMIAHAIAGAQRLFEIARDSKA